MKKRCAWCLDDPICTSYHDEEWGVVVHDDRKLLEMLLLEGAQAGLSWLTILKKRENYRKAFDNFKAEKIARYGPKQIRRLLADAGIVRNRLKIESAIRNARAFLDVQGEFGSFDAFLWRLMDSAPKQNAWTSLAQIPASTPDSDAVSKALKKRGFNFVGTAICYAFMQSIGMVNDHVTDCFRHAQIRVSGNPGPRQAGGE